MGRKIMVGIQKYQVEISCVVGLCLAILMGSVYQFNETCQSIRENTFRLHIKANSDGVEDQNLKLQVRDEILKTTEELFAQAPKKEVAKEISGQQLEKIQEIATQVVKEKGYDYPVSAKVDNLYFNTRYYDTFTLPAGYYDALSIDIGSGAGQNWWCVLFPPLCLPAVTETQTKGEMDTKYTEEEQDVMVHGEEYEVGFALIELFEKVKNLFRR